MSIVRALMLLALIAWIGGIMFFAFVLAPTVFRVLPVSLAGKVFSNRRMSLERPESEGAEEGSFRVDFLGPR